MSAADATDMLSGSMAQCLRGLVAPVSFLLCDHEESENQDNSTHMDGEGGEVERRLFIDCASKSSIAPFFGQIMLVFFFQIMPLFFKIVLVRKHGKMSGKIDQL